MSSRRAVRQVLGCGLSVLTCGAWLLASGAGAPAATGAEAPAASQPPAAGLTPVDPALLSGRTLTLRDANFAIMAPGPEWEWREKPAADLKGTRMFFCAKGGAGLAFSVIDTAVPEDFKLDGKLLEDHGRDLTKNFQLAGWKLSGYTYEPAAMPIAGSYVARFRMDQDGSPTLYCVNWTLWTGHEIGLQMCSAAEKADPAAFTSFVISAHTLAPQPAPGGGREEALTKLYLWVWLGALCLAAVINRIRGGSMRIWRWSGAAVAVAAAITIVIALLQPGVRQQPLAEAILIVARILVCTVPPFLFNAIGSIVSWRRAKARAAKALAAGAVAPPAVVAPPAAAGPQQ